MRQVLLILSALLALRPGQALEMSAAARLQALEPELASRPQRWFLSGEEEGLRQAEQWAGERLRRKGRTALSLLLDHEDLQALRARPFAQGLLLEPVQRMRPALDLAREAIGADQVLAPWGGGPGLDGEGALIGIVDTGIDFTHPDFRGADDELRILSYWDQVEQQVYSRETLLGGSIPNRDAEGHGTHVAGIAGGGGQASEGRFRGLAPEAELLIVRTTFYEDDVFAAVDWIFDQAALAGRPCVVNLSLESPLGPHDGSSSFERELSALTGPGRALVVAAGNTANSGRHYSASGFRQDELQFTPQSPDEAIVEVYAESIVAASFELLAPDGTAFEPANQSRSWSGATVIFPPPVVRNGKRTLQLRIDNGMGDWRLRMSLPAGQTGSWHAWGYQLVFADPDPYTTVSVPATADSALSAGSWISRWSWESRAGSRQYAGEDRSGEPSAFSARGPRVDGRQIPHLLLPGQGIFSPMSSLIVGDTREREFPGAPYYLLQGTSMSAPALAGVVALALSLRPEMGPAALEAWLRQGGEEWTPESGHGLPDLPALFLQLQGPVAELRARADLDRVELSWELATALPGGSQSLYRERAAGEDPLGTWETEEPAFFVYSDSLISSGEQLRYRLDLFDAQQELAGRVYSAQTGLLSAGPSLLLGAPRPNPARSLVYCELLPGEAGRLRWSLYTLLGQRLDGGETVLQAGRQTLRLDLSGAASGRCFLELDFAGRREVHPITVIR